jgi:hypothetical protein
VEATLTRVDYDLRIDGDLAAGRASLTVDVLKDGWVRVPIPAGLLVREAKLDGKLVSLVPGGSGKGSNQLSALDFRQDPADLVGIARRDEQADAPPDDLGRRVAVHQLGAPVPPAGMPGPFSLSESGALADVLAAAGFQGVDVREVAVPMHVGSFDEWWSIVPSLAGPIAALLSSLPDDITSAIRSDAESALADFVTETGYIPDAVLSGRCPAVRSVERQFPAFEGPYRGPHGAFHGYPGAIATRTGASHARTEGICGRSCGAAVSARLSAVPLLEQRIAIRVAHRADHFCRRDSDS